MLLVLPRGLILVALMIATIGPVLADEPPTSPWKGKAALSYIVKNGNSHSNSLYAKGAISYSWTKWQVSLKGEGGRERSRNDTTHDMQRTSEKYYGELREERNISESNYLYHLTTFENDNFSGYRYQLSDSLGYGRRLLHTKSQQLSVEVGPGYRLRKYRDNSTLEHAGEKQQSALLHLGVTYDWQLTESTQFSEDFQEALANKGGYSVRAETSLTTMLNSHLAFSVAHLLTHDSEVPINSAKTDSQITMSLVYKLN